jgi:hypothetical protein
MADAIVPFTSTNSAPLPPICVGCGRAGTWRRRVRVPGASSGVSVLVSVTAHAALDNLERMARSPGSVLVPVCWWHRWIVPPAVTASTDGERVRLSGVSSEFAAAVRGG